MKNFEKYATVTWTAQDIKAIRPNWDLEKCELMLSTFEGHIQDRITELGWEVLDILIPTE